MQTNLDLYVIINATQTNQKPKMKIMTTWKTLFTFIAILATSLTANSATPTASCIINGYKMVSLPTPGENTSPTVNDSTRFQKGAIEICVDAIPMTAWAGGRCTKYTTPQKFLERVSSRKDIVFAGLQFNPNSYMHTGGVTLYYCVPDAKEE